MRFHAPTDATPHRDRAAATSAPAAVARHCFAPPPSRLPPLPFSQRPGACAPRNGRRYVRARERALWNGVRTALARRESRAGPASRRGLGAAVPCRRCRAHASAFRRRPPDTLQTRAPRAAPRLPLPSCPLRIPRRPPAASASRRASRGGTPFRRSLRRASRILRDLSIRFLRLQRGLVDRHVRQWVLGLWRDPAGIPRPPRRPGPRCVSVRARGFCMRVSRWHRLLRAAVQTPRCGKMLVAPGCGAAEPRKGGGGEGGCGQGQGPSAQRSAGVPLLERKGPREGSKGVGVGGIWGRVSSV